MGLGWGLARGGRSRCVGLMQSLTIQQLNSLNERRAEFVKRFSVHANHGTKSEYDVCRESAANVFESLKMPTIK